MPADPLSAYNYARQTSLIRAVAEDSEPTASGFEVRVTAQHRDGGALAGSGSGRNLKIARDAAIGELIAHLRDAELAHV